MQTLIECNEKWTIGGPLCGRCRFTFRKEGNPQKRRLVQRQQQQRQFQPTERI